MSCWGMRLQSSSIQLISGSIVDVGIYNKCLIEIGWNKYKCIMIRNTLSRLMHRSNHYYNFSSMKLKIDEQNYLVIDPAKGARVVELRLEGRQIIKGELSGLGNSSYLMYPWVNRIQTVPFANNKPPYYDGNGIPLHGFYVDSPRNVSVFNAGQGKIGVQLIPQEHIADVSLFTETFVLSKGRLHQKIKIHNSGNEKLPFCFGYHPYLQIDNEDIANLKITTDIKTNLKLDEKLMTIYPYERSDIVVNPAQKYDHLFEGGSFLQITSKDGFNVRINSKLPYWQIYTPPEGKRIAVEPMTFTGNLYKIAETGFGPKLNEGELQILAWQHQ